MSNVVPFGGMAPGNFASFPQGVLPPVKPPPEPESLKKLMQWAEMPNVAADTEIPEDVLKELSQQVHEGYEIDLSSRGDWEETAERAVEAATQKRQGKNYPFPNASNVKYPLIAIAALQFNARAYPAICNGRDLVRVKVGGGDPQGLKSARAQRVAQFMSHQIADGMPHWEHEMDWLLLQEPVVGAAFKKSYWDFERNGPDTKVISAFDLVVNQKTKDIISCPRISHRFELYPYEIEQRQRAGLFLEDVDVIAQSGVDKDRQDPIEFIEQHCYFDLDGDGYAEPWIVTQTCESQQLVRVIAAFDALDIVHDGETIVRIPKDDYFSPYGFLPNIEGGFYGMGFGHLLDSFSEVINSSFNQMLDAGHLQNAGGGFIGSGLDFQSEEEEFRFEPGRYYNVTAEAGDIRSNVVSVEHPGPSPVLFQLLGMMMDSAKQMTNIQDILTGAAGAQNMQPTTLMALIDQGMKVFTAIYKRIYDSLSYEFRILYRLNRKHLSDKEYSDYLGQPASVKADFADDGCLVCPVADPNSVTMMQKMATSSFLMQVKNDPDFKAMLNPQAILMRVLSAANIDNVQEILAQPKPPTPADQLAVQEKVAQIQNLQSQTAHNFALADAESKRGENYAAKTADVIMGHQPNFFENPPA